MGGRVIFMGQDTDLAAVVSTAAQDIGSFIKAHREAAQVSVRQLARKAGVSNPYLSQIERGLRKPSAEVLSQIAKALRVSAEVFYVQAGILEPGEASEVQHAIIADTALTERQKYILLDIYTALCEQNSATGLTADHITSTPRNGSTHIAAHIPPDLTPDVTTDTTPNQPSQ